ncbi:MAG: DUF5678 domain-containing protein [Chloroflexota bacterium]
MSTLDLPTTLTKEIRWEAETAGMSVADLLGDAIYHYKLVLQRRKINAEATWWNSASSEIRDIYQGEYVAIHCQQIVDHDVDRAALYDRVRKKYEDAAVLITPARGIPTLRILSPRLERL